MGDLGGPGAVNLLEQLKEERRLYTKEKTRQAFSKFFLFLGTFSGGFVIGFFASRVL